MIFPIEFATKQELQDYLNVFDFDSIKDTKLSSVYFLVEFDGHTIPVYFWRWSDVWFASPCVSSSYPFKDDETMEFVKELYNEEEWEDACEYEKSMVRDGWHYEIYCPQCSPFLPDKIRIINIFSDSGCLDWMLEQRALAKEDTE